MLGSRKNALIMVLGRKVEYNKRGFDGLSCEWCGEPIRKTDLAASEDVGYCPQCGHFTSTERQTVRPVTPIFSILLTLALPIGQLMAFCAWHEREIFRYRRFWVLDGAMVKAGGFEFLSSLGSAVTYPFLQTEGYFALILAFLLFPVFTILERKAGHVRFLMIIAILWITSLVAHALQIVWDLRTVAYMCGIGPIALGTVAYLHKAYPNLRFQWMKGCNIASIYLFLVAMVLLMERCFGCLGVESYSFAFLALFSCGAVGAWLGRRKRKPHELRDA